MSLLTLRRFIPLSLLLFVFLVPSAQGADTQRPIIDELSFNFPIDGGLMVMGSRLWPVGRFMRGGVVLGGGVIKREFDFSTPAYSSWDGQTDAAVFPFVGPQVSFFYEFIGVSVAYGVFYAKTDFEAKGPGGNNWKGKTSGWGTGFYSPLISIDFYNQKRNVVYGFGIGGFLGGSYPDLEATFNGQRITVAESPLDTISFHVKTMWASGRKKKQSAPEPLE